MNTIRKVVSFLVAVFMFLFVVVTAWLLLFAVADSVTPTTYGATEQMMKVYEWPGDASECVIKKLMKFQLTYEEFAANADAGLIDYRLQNDLNAQWREVEGCPEWPDWEKE